MDYIELNEAKYCKSSAMWFRPKLSVTEQSLEVTVAGVLLKPVPKGILRWLMMITCDGTLMQGCRKWYSLNGNGRTGF